MLSALSVSLADRSSAGRCSMSASISVVVTACRPRKSIGPLFRSHAISRSTPPANSLRLVAAIRAVRARALAPARSAGMRLASTTAKDGLPSAKAAEMFHGRPMNSPGL